MTSSAGPFQRYGHPLGLLKQVVVAGGGEVATEQGPDEAQRRVLAVHPAALALAICPAAATVTADGGVELDAAAGHGGRRRGVRPGEQEEAAPQPVSALAATATGPAQGQVEGDGRVGENQGRVLREGAVADPRCDADRDAATQTIPALEAIGPGGTDGPVADDRAADDGGDRGVVGAEEAPLRDLDPPTGGEARLYRAITRGARPRDGQVVEDQAVPHRHRRGDDVLEAAAQGVPAGTAGAGAPPRHVAADRGVGHVEDAEEEVRDSAAEGA